MSFKEQLEQKLLEQRPLSKSTLKTYVSLLTALQRKLNKGELTLSFYDDQADAILEHVESQDKAQTKKTQLSSLYVLTQNEDYRDAMMKNIKQVNEHYRSQRTDPERLKNVVSFAEIQRMHNQYKSAYKANPSNDRLNDLLISALHSGAVEGLPPRRVMDYALMKVGGTIDREKDNYYDSTRKAFVFNQFKTKKHHGAQMLEVPKEVVMLVNKRKKVASNGYLLENESGEPYTQSALSKKVKQMFAGNSQDVLRSIFLSHLYKDLPAVSFLQDTADKMGHSIDSALSSDVKKDKPN